MSLRWNSVFVGLVTVLCIFVAVWLANLGKSQHENTSKVLQLTRLDPVEVGYVREIKLVSGQLHKIRTLSMRPALFEIENFLSDEECEDIIFMAETQGLETSQTLVSNADNINDTILQGVLARPTESFQHLDANENGVIDKSELATGMSFFSDVIVTDELMQQLMDELDLDADKNNVISLEEYTSMLEPNNLQRIINHTNTMKAEKPRLKLRLSNTAFLSPIEHAGKKTLFDSIRNRIHLVTGLPKDVIWCSEDLQVLRYDESGHYHCHYDSKEEDHQNISCCHYITQSDDNCLPCRFITFFYYLNEPEEGGETAFPIADNDSVAVELIRGEKHHLCDLSNNCHKAKIAYKPKKGTALFWYNHQLNEETGWIGELDKMSYHGGCDVIKGTKWAANNWINVGKNRENDEKSWAEYKQYIKDYDSPDEESTRNKENGQHLGENINEKMESAKVNEKLNENTKNKNEKDNK